jgi:hypothetical protein
MDDKRSSGSLLAQFSGLQELILSEVERLRSQIRRAKDTQHRLRLYRRLVDLGHLGEALMRLTESQLGDNIVESSPGTETASATPPGVHSDEEGRRHLALPLAILKPSGEKAASAPARGKLLRQFRTFLERGRERGRLVMETGELEAQFNRHLRGRLPQALASADIKGFDSLLLLARQEGWLAIFSAGGKLYTYVRGASRNGNGGSG